MGRSIWIRNLALMKNLVLLFIASLAMSCTNAQKNEFSADALQKNLTATDGTQITFAEIIAQHAGRPVVIEVWASWCGDCVKSMPDFKKLQANHPEAAYVFVSMDRTDDQWKYGIAKHQLKGSHYWSADGMKGEFGKSIDLDWIPRYIILDAKGNVVLYRAIESDFEKIDQTLNSLK